jgi:tetratricopeptide (TPR) repeat protein
VFFRRAPGFGAITLLLSAAFATVSQAATVLVLPFHNSSQYPDLNWVGESVSETLKDEFSAHNQIVFARELRLDAQKRLGLRTGADYTKATLIHLGQSLDADYVYYGTFDAKLASGSSELKDSSIQISAHVIDLRKMHEGPDLAEAGKLADLTRLQEHLAWGSLRYLDPSSDLALESFLAPQKLRHADTEESYIRGLLSTDSSQQQKWFMQALALDSRFASPAFELGKLALEKKDYRQTLSWFQRIPATDFRYPEARFRMGMAAYQLGDYGTAVNYFREVAKSFPVNEVYNNLGAAEERLGEPAAADDFRKAAESDPHDTTYVFNLGVSLFRQGHFDEAEKQLQTLLSHDADDQEAQTLLGRAQRHESLEPGKNSLPPLRLKQKLDLTGFRQLKAVVQPKGAS